MVSPNLTYDTSALCLQQTLHLFRMAFLHGAEIIPHDVAYVTLPIAMYKAHRYHSVGFALLNKRVDNFNLSKPSSSGPSRQILAMISTLVLVLGSPLALTFASTLQDTGGPTIQLSPVDFPLPANVSENETANTLNTSNAIQVQCDGEKYGFNPDVSDCEKARSYYKRSSQLFTYGERHSGHEVNVFPLPYRLMGGRQPESLKFFLSISAQIIPLTHLADEGLCYFEPVLVDSSLGTGVASINHLSNAAYELILQCAGRQSKGGIATGIGTPQRLRSSACRNRLSFNAHTHQVDGTWQWSSVLISRMYNVEAPSAHGPLAGVY